MCEHCWFPVGVSQAKEEASRKEAQAAQTRQVAEREEVERRRREVEEGAKVAKEEEATRQRSAVVKEEAAEGQKDLGGEAGFGVQGERFRMVRRGRSLVGRRGGRSGGGPGGGSSRNRSTAETGQLPGSFQGICGRPLQADCETTLLKPSGCQVAVSDW